MRVAALGLILSLCLSPSCFAAEPQGGEPAPCPVPAALLTPGHDLPHAAAAVAAGGPLRVLAIGSGATSGQDESGRAAYPRLTETALRRDLPGVAVEVTVRGHLGMTAAEMVRALDAELMPPRRFDIVIWQTGTVEAIHAVSGALLRDTLGLGAAKVDAAGADLVLVGPQFSRALVERAKLEPVTAALRETAAASGRAFFDRLAITEGWVENGTLDLERIGDRTARRGALERRHACVGDALARFIVNGAVQH